MLVLLVLWLWWGLCRCLWVCRGGRARRGRWWGGSNLNTKGGANVGLPEALGVGSAMGRMLL